MKTALGITLAVFCAVFPFASALAEGSSGRGGGDLRPIDSGSAWFLGAEPVRLCLDVAPAFGTSASNAADALNAALANWKQYVDASGVNGNRQAGRDVRIDTNFVVDPKCSGNEDIHVYLGVSNPETDTVRALYADPLGFAHREQYSLDTGRGKGFIWIKSSEAWSLPDSLQGLLTHEIGHTLGCDHVPGTIMEEDIADLVLQTSKPLLHRLRMTRIDGSKVLSFHPMSFEGSMDEETFRKFTGRAPVGRFSGTLHFSPGSSLILLYFNDERGHIGLQIRSDDGQGSATSAVAISGDVFRVARNLPGGGSVLFKDQASAFSLYGAVSTLPANEQVPVTIDMNMGWDSTQGPIQVRYFEGSAYDGIRRHDLLNVPMIQ